jgi:hypothetical protein
MPLMPSVNSSLNFVKLALSADGKVNSNDQPEGG